MLSKPPLVCPGHGLSTPTPQTSVPHLLIPPDPSTAHNPHTYAHKHMLTCRFSGTHLHTCLGAPRPISCCPGPHLLILIHPLASSDQPGPGHTNLPQQQTARSSDPFPQHCSWTRGAHTCQELIRSLKSKLLELMKMIFCRWPLATGKL